MKQRVGFVSNSSSSSFILMETPAIAGLTSGDWNVMIKDLYKDYDKRMEEHRKFLEEEHLDDVAHPIFCAFDMKTERKEAEGELLKWLRYWMASNSAIHNGVLEKTDFDMEDAWYAVCDSMEHRIRSELLCSYDYVDVDIYINSRDDIRSTDICGVKITGWQGRKRVVIPAKEEYLKALEDKWDELGLCDNADVLKSDKARFAVHFDENEYYELDGVVSDEGDGWETESYTYGRLCEVFARWLVQHGKVPAGFGWRDLLYATLTVNMHEG